MFWSRSWDGFLAGASRKKCLWNTAESAATLGRAVL